MNMSGVNFDWRFSHRAEIYGALYTYPNEPLTIKNGPRSRAGGWVNASRRPITTQPITIHPRLHKQNQRETRAYVSPGHIWKIMTWKHTGALTQQLETATTSLLLLVTERLLWEWEERNIKLHSVVISKNIIAGIFFLRIAAKMHSSVGDYTSLPLKISFNATNYS